MHPIRHNILAVAILLASVGNLIYVIWNLTQHSGKATRLEYTYRGHDFPETLLLRALDSVLLSTEETVHYQLLGNTSDAVWFSLTSAGYGYTRLGPDDRVFMVTMFHELHCLRMLNFAIGDWASVEHVHHCLNYLRQTTLCAADLTLEPGDFTTRDFENDRTGATHMCRDWSVVYDAMQESMDRWMSKSHEKN